MNDDYKRGAQEFKKLYKYGFIIEGFVAFPPQSNYCLVYEGPDNWRMRESSESIYVEKDPVKTLENYLRSWPCAPDKILSDTNISKEIKKVILMNMDKFI